MPTGEDKPGTHPEDGESEPTGEDKLGTRPKGGESERSADKPGTHPEDGESEPTGEDKPGTHPEDGESEPTGEDKLGRTNWGPTRRVGSPSPQARTKRAVYGWKPGGPTELSDWGAGGSCYSKTSGSRLEL